MSRTFRSWILLLGDLGLMYAALALTLWLRMSAQGYVDSWSEHFLPFTFLNLIWIAVFYIQDLYSRRHFRINGAFIRGFILATLVNTFVVIVFFYLAPDFGISPKTNLVIYVMLFSGFFLLWRTFAGGWMTDVRSRVPVAFLDLDEGSLERVEMLSRSSTALFRVVCCEQQDAYLEGITNGTIELLVVGNQAYQRRREELYGVLARGIEVRDAASFWEEYHQQTPIELVDANWFLSGFATSQRREFELLKRAFDILVSSVLLLSFSGFAVGCALLIKATSRGPVLYKQTRLGKLGKPFLLYKFRSMHTDAEKDGPAWAQKHDARVTVLGRALRHTHFDEYPQLWNILKGEMSFIGPRPERPEFVAELKERIPFYDLRHLVKPGITGWAQIHHPYGASVEDAKAKLSYDLYYIKHRSWFLDFKICLKTLAMLFKGEGR